MILLPQRLFGNPGVQTILKDQNVCILQKEIDTPILKREGYISNHVISILLQGEQILQTYDDEIIRIKASEVLFIPRGMYYISDVIPAGGKFKSLLFYFDDRLIEQFLSNTRVNKVEREGAPAAYLKFGVVPTISNFATSLIDIYQNHQIHSKRFLDLKILELLYLLNTLASEQEFASFLFRLTLPKKRNVKKFMEQNFDKPLKVEDYAYLTGRSLSSFRRDFKTFYNVTPQKWLKDKRLDKALLLLEEKEMSVTELAFEVGYENISYFIKAFKTKVGLSPKQFILSKHRNNLQN